MTNDADRDTPPQARWPRLAMASLLAVTTLGTVGNNVISVPLRLITDELQAPLSAGILASGIYVLFMAVATPIAGWLGDRWGMRRILLWSLVLMLIAQCVAAVASDIWTLAVARAIQGVACSGFPPLVMGMLMSLFTDRRLGVMAAWATANGLGQAIGPPLGALIADLAHWRVIFIVMAVTTALALLGVRLSVPALPGRAGSMDLGGAILLCAGVGVLLSTAMLTGLEGVPTGAVFVIAVVGAILLGSFIWDVRRKPDPFVPLRLIADPLFFRNTVAAFAQMFALGSVLIAAPLYLTGPGGLSPTISGAALFALTFVMAVSAPLAARLSRRFTASRVLRAGLVIVAIGTIAVALSSLLTGAAIVWAMVPALIASGLGIALVQTPAATGVTESAGGSRGAGLGVYTMMRFAGSTAGAAWVAVAYTGTTLGVVAAGIVVTAAAAFVVTFLGRAPHRGKDVSPTRP